jgi:hypothetical protein
VDNVTGALLAWLGGKILRAWFNILMQNSSSIY